ncbi:MAG: hypothetical protein NZ519_03060 [Bacteroidia bacterium]|nr:hypothetical protein [Bacteroidia bacterium]
MTDKVAKVILLSINFIFWACPCGHSLRSCPQGRRATGYANASVLRFAPHRADARPSHASRKGSLKNSFLCNLYKVLACKSLYFKLKQGKDITAQVICVRGMEHARKGSTKR